MNADDVDILGVQDNLYDKNLYAYCDNDPVCRIDETGKVWELAIIGGGSITLGTGISISTVVAGLSLIAPVVIAIVATAVIVAGVSAIIKYTKRKSKEKSKEEVDPYARPGQKNKGEKRRAKVEEVVTLKVEITNGIRNRQSIIHQVRNIRNISRQNKKNCQLKETRYASLVFRKMEKIY